MNAAARKKQAVSAGRKRGAVLGVFFFLGAGMLPGFSLGSYAALILFSHLSGTAAEPGWTARILIAAGGATGAVSAGSIMMLTGSVAGALLASAVESLKQRRQNQKAEQARSRKGMNVLMHDRMTGHLESEIRARLSFLANYRGWIRSIVVVGSAAHASQERGSDVDIVIVCKKEGLEPVRDAVSDQEISAAVDNREERIFEYTLFTPSEVQRLFRMSSPFAYALCHGLVLEDDGFLKNLPAAELRTPSRTFVLSALHESIIVPYYGSFRSLHANAQARGCSLECCRERRSGCDGISAADLPAKVILRMLYLTLPFRNCMPLTKEDVAAFARLVYGEESGEIAERAVSAARRDGKRIYYTDYLQFRRFAGVLYREILRSVGIDGAVAAMLRDGASMAQGKYGALKDRKYRNCVLNT